VRATRFAAVGHPIILPESGPRGRRAIDDAGERLLKKYMCLICGWIYDEAAGAPDEGIAPGTKWEDVPPNWTCPECGARKDDFEMIEF
jgi:rubredoxin